jgi:hypothetical protein
VNRVNIRSFLRAVVSSWLILVAGAGVAAAQSIDDHWDHWGRHVLRVGQDFNLKDGAMVEEVVVIAGNATIEGVVDHDVIVVLGKAQLAKTARIEGSLVVAGGSAFVEPEAMVHGDLVVVGGVVEAAPGFTPGGQHIVIGTQALGGTFNAFVPWIRAACCGDGRSCPNWGGCGSSSASSSSCTWLLVCCSAARCATRPRNWPTSR